MNTAFNILLAEDNADDVFLLQQAFKKAGVDSRLHVAQDGREAVEYLKGEGSYGDRAACPFPDVLLLDLNMPRMNGFEVLEWVRRHPQYGRIIVHVLTTSVRELDVERAYDLRANSYIVKPSRVDDLVQFVRALHEWHRFVSLPQDTRPAGQTG